MADKNGNGRVTLALVKRDTEEIKQEVRRLAECWQEDHDRIGTLEGETRRINDRVSVWAAGQSFLTMLASSAAAFLGMRH